MGTTPYIWVRGSLADIGGVARAGVHVSTRLVHPDVVLADGLDGIDTTATPAVLPTAYATPGEPGVTDDRGIFWLPLVHSPDAVYALGVPGHPEVFLDCALYPAGAEVPYGDLVDALPASARPAGAVATSITAAPDRVGRLAVVAGVGYLATGTAAAADWKRIT